MTKRYGVVHEGHDVELEFDRHRIVLNEASVHLDGEVVDSKKVYYGEKELTAKAADGTDIVVRVHSGMHGELTRAQLRRRDGAWIDLEERNPSG